MIEDIYVHRFSFWFLFVSFLFGSLLQTKLAAYKLLTLLVINQSINQSINQLINTIFVHSNYRTWPKTKTSSPWVNCEAQLAWKCIFTPIFRCFGDFDPSSWSNWPVFGVRLRFDSMGLCLQDYKSVRIGYDLCQPCSLKSRHAHTVNIWSAYMNSSAS